MYTLTLDPQPIAVGRTALELNAGPIRVGGTSTGQGIDWGQAAIASYMADMRTGSSPVDYRTPNRTVTIPLGLGMDSTSFVAAKAKLTQKVALIQRERGWLRRGDTGWYADVVDAALTIPDVWGEGGGIEVGLVLVLTCLPDFYGDEIPLDSANATGQLSAVIKQSTAQALIAGDHPARCRILVSDTAGQNQDGLLWGVRSRHYDPASTAKLFYEAETLTPLDAAATFGHAGASGGSTMRHNSLPGGSWCPVLLTDIASGTAAWTHQGSYRVWARCYSATATPQLRFIWGVGDVAHPVTNDIVTLPGAANFYLLDLGEVRLDAPPTGNYRWHGVIQAKAATQGDPIEIDCLYLQPLDESAGKLVAVQSDSALGISTQRPAGSQADDASVGTIPWLFDSGDIFTEDTFPAAAVNAGTSHYLLAQNFGFALPAGALIVGIRVEIKRTGGPGGPVYDSRVRLIKAAIIQAGEKADTATPWPATYQFKSYGGQTDLWGSSWTAADINDPGFGIALSVLNTPESAVTTIAEVDFIRISVYFGGGFSTVADAVLYGTRQAELRTEGMFRQDATGTVEGNVAQVSGDLPRLPPSGLEGRAVELFVKPSRGDLASLPDSGLDGFTAQLVYRPTFLTSP